MDFPRKSGKKFSKPKKVYVGSVNEFRVVGDSASITITFTAGDGSRRIFVNGMYAGSSAGSVTITISPEA
jgi:hypothetical protein